MNGENSTKIRQQILKALDYMLYPKYYVYDEYRDFKKELAHDRSKFNCADDVKKIGDVE